MELVKVRLIITVAEEVLTVEDESSNFYAPYGLSIWRFDDIHLPENGLNMKA